MRVLVIGARGFVGRYAARAFKAAGHEVTGIGHGSWTSHAEWGVSQWTDLHVSVANLMNQGRDFDVVVNCAGSGNVGFSFQNPLEDFDKNVKTTMETLEFVRLHCAKTPIVTLSSAGVYGKVETMPISETTALKPVSPYGTHKWLSEEICRSYCTHFGLNVAVIRPFSVYGPGLRKQLLWDASQKITRGEAQFFGTGLETRDWIHVEDLGELMVLLASKPTSGFVVLNGGTGVQTSNRSILEMLARGLGFSGEIRFMGQGRPGDPEHYLANIDAAKATGWAPRVTLDRGVAEYAKWFLDEGPESN